MPDETDTTGWAVERIDTEPMTPSQHRDAITALASLITEWNAKEHSA